MTHWDARDFITYLMDLNRKADQEDRIQAIRDKNNQKAPPFDPLKMVMMDSVHEVRKAVDGSWQFLVIFKSLELAPEWRPFHEVPTGSINNLIHDLKVDYYRALGKPIRY